MGYFMGGVLACSPALALPALRYPSEARAWAQAWAWAWVHGMQGERPTIPWPVILPLDSQYIGHGIREEVLIMIFITHYT